MQASDAWVGQAEAELTLGQFLRRISGHHADRACIRFEDRVWTYRDLEWEARQRAKALLAAGVGKGQHVALLFGNRPEWVFNMLGAGMIGAVIVPVNTFANREERNHILRHSDAEVLLLQSQLLKHQYLDELVEEYPEIRKAPAGRIRTNALPMLRRVQCMDEPSEFLQLGHEVSDEFLESVMLEVKPTDPALLIYTSGTTAMPKGVMHRQRTPVIQSWRFAEQMRLAPDDVVWTAQPFFWTAGIAMSLGATFAAGACLVLQEVFEAGAALDLIESEAVTTLHAWPHQEKQLGEHPTAATRDLSALQKVKFSNPLAKFAGLTEDLWDPEGSYGCSESFTIASSIPADAALELRKKTHGRPLPGVELRIMDAESGEILSPGQTGEIVIRGVTLMSGYYKVPPEETFDANGYFHTQDGGWLDAEGYLHWTGRLSSLIKTGGANVSPVEIDGHIEMHPDVRLGRSVGVPHPTLGEAVVLCVVRVEGSSIQEAELREFLRSKLAAYKVPKAVLFFEPGELELTGTEKVQLGPLRAAAEKRLATDAVTIDGHGYLVAGQA